MLRRDGGRALLIVPEAGRLKLGFEGDEALL
jgi:hypothetical protein